MAIYSTAKDAKFLGLFGYFDPAIAPKVPDVIVYDKTQHILNMVRVLKPFARFLLDAEKAEKLLKFPIGTFASLVEAEPEADPIATVPVATTPPTDDTIIRVSQRWKASGTYKVFMEVKASQLPEVEEWIKKGATFDPGRTFWRFELTSGKLVKNVTL